MEEARMIDLLEAMKIHPAFNTIREDLVGNSFELNNAVDKAIDCLKRESSHIDAECMHEDAKQASIPYTYNAPQHDWKCGYPDITEGNYYNWRGEVE